MDTEQALDVAREPNKYTSLQQAEARTVLAAKVIAMRTAETDVTATWQQHRDNPHIPPELRRVLNAFVEQRSTKDRERNVHTPAIPGADQGTAPGRTSARAAVLDRPLVRPRSTHLAGPGANRPDQDRRRQAVRDHRCRARGAAKDRHAAR